MQFVGYRPRDQNGPAALLLAEDGDVTRVTLDAGATLAYALGERRCAGTITEDGHVACANADAPYCPQHTSTWVCAKCRGECLKDEMDCHEAHALYLAAFAPDTVKVGVTREWRLETRLREQGADAAAHVDTFENGRIAREREADLAARFPDRVRVPAKIAGLAENVDEAAWRDALDGFDPIDTYAFDYGLALDSRPVPEVLAAGPIVGAKGRVLCLEREGTVYAVDLRDLVGFEVTAGARER
ncbi:DUF2797 domain-containing protein, partial [Halarchaeum acidiphilum]|uniref:DUF2797 domain-containing protein n=1 Tax=Halarchaeum acidiphilum TaxID=489138 RepID=UPI000677BA3A